MHKIGNVVRISSTTGDWPGRIEADLGKDKWKVYDLGTEGYATVRTDDIAGLWEGELPAAKTKPAAGEAGGPEQRGDDADANGENAATESPATDEKSKAAPPMTEAIIEANFGRFFVIETTTGLGRKDHRAVFAAAGPLGCLRP